MRPLPWKHRPFPELVRLAWPIAVSTLSYSVMTLVDTLFVGRLGASALAGVSLGGVATFTILCFGFGALRASKVLVSQSIGAGRRQELGAWLGAGLAVGVVFGLGAWAAGEILATQLYRITASAEAARHAGTYLSVRMWAAPVLMAYVALREHRYGLGDTRSPMVASLVANIANIALCWLLIVQLDQGVFGAALATSIAHVLEVGVLLVAQSKEGWGVRAMRWSHVRELARVGVPTGLQFLLEVGSFALLTVIVSGFGDVQLAAHQIAIQVIHFSFLPTMALGEAASVMAGQAVGAGEVRLVRRVARSALVTAAAYTAVCTLALVLGSSVIASAFTDEPELLATAGSLLLIAAVFQIADGAAVVARSVLRGTGDVRYPAFVGIACAWVTTPPLAWLLGRELGLGALGGWIGLSAEILIAAGLFWLRLERGGWLRHAKESRARILADREPALAAA